MFSRLSKAVFDGQLQCLQLRSRRREEAEVIVKRQQFQRLFSLASAILILFLFCCFPLGAANWPQFRGPSGLGYVMDTNLPHTWNAKTGENILWKIPLAKSDNPFSSPIVWQDRIFLTSVLNSPLEHHLLCFSTSDGKALWDTPVPPGPWTLKDLRGGYCAPTPCTDGNKVFAVFGSAVIAAVDFSGKIIWRKELEPYKFDVALGSSPIVFKDMVILDCDQTGKTSYLLAFDTNSGDVRWRQERPQAGFAHSTPAIVSVNDKPQMLVSASNAIQGVDPETGNIIWWCSAQGDAASPAFSRNLVFSDSGRGGKAVCVDSTGKGDVTKTHLKWTYPQIPEGLSSALIAPSGAEPAKQFVYRTHSPETLKCIELASGKLAWSERLAGISTWASPIATPQGLIYFASAGKSYILRAGPTLDLISTNDLAEESRSSAAVANNQIFVRGNKNLFCIGNR